VLIGDAAPESLAKLEEVKRCPQRSLPLSPGPLGCIQLPDEEELALDAKRSAHARRTGTASRDPLLGPRLGEEEQIPRLPERPEPFEQYQLPVDPARAVFHTEAPATPSTQSRQGIRIRSERGAPVSLIDLEGQSARPEVLLVGQLHGITVIVRHRVERDKTARSYLAIYGQLARPGPGIVSDQKLDPLSVIGYLADGEDVTPELYFEIRRERSSEGTSSPYLSQLVSSAISVATDPRNVLPLRK
jgi:hypothetical protein